LIFGFFCEQSLALISGPPIGGEKMAISPDEKWDFHLSHSVCRAKIRTKIRDDGLAGHFFVRQAGAVEKPEG
jgi:hypothetical protein